MMEVVHISKKNSSIHATLADFFEDSVVNDFPLTDNVEN